MKDLRDVSAAFALLSLKSIMSLKTFLYLLKPYPMILLAKAIIALVAIEHLYILWLEMFAWTTRGKKVFGTKGVSPTYFEDTKTLAANQGLYNGFLAAGLIWSLVISDPVWSIYVALFFLGCVLVAGLYGAATASKKILYVQALPALVGIVLNVLRLSGIVDG